MKYETAAPDAPTSGKYIPKIISTIIGIRLKLLLSATSTTFEKTTMADRWNLPENRRFGDFHEILKAEKLADASSFVVYLVNIKK